MFFEWDSSLETGIDVIDQQHRRIVDYINSLDTAIVMQDRRGVSNVLDELIEYTQSHFSFEEEMMASHDYIHVENHKKVHAMFTQRIDRYKQEFEAGKDVSRKLLTDLKIWLSNHIKLEDGDYAKTLKQELSSSWLQRTLGRFVGL